MRGRQKNFSAVPGPVKRRTARKTALILSRTLRQGSEQGPPGLDGDLAGGGGLPFFQGIAQQGLPLAVIPDQAGESRTPGIRRIVKQDAVDVIVDIVESGKTLEANGLKVLEEVCKCSARVVVNRVSLKTKKELIPLFEKIRKNV